MTSPDPAHGSISFPNSHPFLLSLCEYLQSRHGRNRSEREARQICTDVSKYLYFASPEALKQELLLDSSKLNNYLKTLEPDVQPSTQNAKLNRIRQGLHFLALSLDASGLLEVQRVEGLIKNWSAVLAKSSRVANRERLEDKSEEPLNFGDVESFVSSKEFHQLARRLVSDAKHGRPVDHSHLHDVELWLAGSILHTNSQRPGAITNITVAECEKATAGKTAKATIRVTKHKTKTTGSAMVTVKGALLEQLAAYLQYLHPLLPEGPLLFPNARGKPFDHFSRSVKQLGERFGMKMPTATEGRHTAATATAKSCSDQDRDAVATTMSHSRQTQMTYYVNLKSREQAEKGFDILQDLRRGQTTPKAQKRVPYTPEEEETTALYFESYIEA